MKKGLVTILAVAIIGALGIYSKSHSSGNAILGNGDNSTTSTLGDSTSTGQTSASMAESNTPATYKDGTYTGENEDTAYGAVQISMTISGGKIININFLRMPDDLDHTREVTAYSQPLLKQETLQKQSGNIDFVTGATQTSEGYRLSLQSALDQAA